MEQTVKEQHEIYNLKDCDTEYMKSTFKKMKNILDYDSMTDNNFCLEAAIQKLIDIKENGCLQHSVYKACLVELTTILLNTNNVSITAKQKFLNIVAQLSKEMMVNPRKSEVCFEPFNGQTRQLKFERYIKRLHLTKLENKRKHFISSENMLIPSECSSLKKAKIMRASIWIMDQETKPSAAIKVVAINKEQQPLLKCSTSFVSALNEKDKNRLNLPSSLIGKKNLHKKLIVKNENVGTVKNGNVVTEKATKPIKPTSSTLRFQKVESKICLSKVSVTKEPFAFSSMFITKSLQPDSATSDDTLNQSNRYDYLTSRFFLRTEKINSDANSNLLPPLSIFLD